MSPDNLAFTLPVLCRLYLVGNLDFITQFRDIFVGANYYYHGLVATTANQGCSWRGLPEGR